MAATLDGLTQRASRIRGGNIDSKIVIIVPEQYYSDMIKQLNKYMRHAMALQAVAGYMHKRLLRGSC